MQNNDRDELEKMCLEKGREISCAPVLGNVDLADERLVVLERAIMSARNGIVITDPRLEDNPIVYVNPSFLLLSGYSREEVLGKNCRFLQGDDRNQSAVDALRSAMKEEKPITVVLRNYTKKGVLFWNELTITPVHDSKGKLVNFIGIQNDISARKEADRRIAEFYSMVSHELRTPLTSIRTSLGLLEEGTGGELSDDSRKLVEIAFRNSGRLVRLVNDILDFRKIESGKLELDYSQVDPEGIVKQVQNELAPTARERNIDLAIKLEVKEKFDGDRDRLIQVLTNLVANAVKFSPENGTVTIKVVPGINNSVSFRVSDNGPGIPRSEFGKLFKKFQQIDSSDTRKSGGTGLGLAISKYLVEMHGGTIGVDSKPGDGSTFWFEVPLAKPLA